MILSDISHLTKGSHNIVTVSCDIKKAYKCRDKYDMAYKDAVRYMNKNNGKNICQACAQIGKENGNSKYDVPDLFFQNIDSEEKAYLLGWIISDGCISKRGFTIAITDKNILEILRDIICTDLPIKIKHGINKNPLYSLTVNSQQISQDLCKLLKINPGPKSKTVNFPDIKECYQRACIRGIFDGDGTINDTRNKKRYPQCSIASSSNNLLSKIKDIINIPAYQGNSSLEYSHTNALDFLSKLYDKAGQYKLQRKYQKYLEWTCYVPGLKGSGNSIQINNLYVQKTHTSAVLPKKPSASDVGYDITAIKKIKQVGDVEFYDTGLKIRPEFGWYAELVPRSSISKSGYMFANSIGIIDRSYVGNIILALIKHDKKMPDLELPYRIAQIIPRPITHFDIVEVDNLEETARGNKGFGSSGSK